MVVWTRLYWKPEFMPVSSLNVASLSHEMIQPSQLETSNLPKFIQRGRDSIFMKPTEAITSGSSLGDPKTHFCLCACLCLFFSSFHSLDWKRGDREKENMWRKAQQTEHWKMGAADANYQIVPGSIWHAEVLGWLSRWNTGVGIGILNSNQAQDTNHKATY